MNEVDDLVVDSILELFYLAPNAEHIIAKEMLLRNSNWAENIAEEIIAQIKYGVRSEVGNQ